MKAYVLSVLFVSQILLNVAAQAQTVVNKPTSITSLAQAWEWGLGEASGRDKAWVAYGFSVELDEKFQVGFSSRHDNFVEWNHVNHGRWSGNWYNSSAGGWRNRHSFDSLQAGATTPQDDFDIQQDLLFLALFENGAIAELRVVQKDSLINWFAAPVYWLGDVSQQEGFNHQQSLLSPLFTDGIQRTLVRSIGLHNVAGRDELLTAVAEDESLSSLHFAAIESLAIHKSDSIADFLTGIARNENAELGARRIAISALSRYNDNSNLRMLSELSGRMNPQAVRREAIESLSLIPSDISSEILRELATVDDDRHIVIAALAGLSHRSSEYDTIADVAENHRDEEIRETALEFAARMNGRRAFPLLQRLFERDSSEDVQEEALQAMDNAPAELAVPYLLALAGDEGVANPPLIFVPKLSIPWPNSMPVWFLMI